MLETLTHALTNEPVVALTFDDGPDPVWTPRLLDILAAHQARATFFMVGVCARDHPELVAQVAAKGHVIANHSWDHPSFPLISGEERREQIRACANAIAPHGQPLFRPPYGHQDLASWLDVTQLGYQVVGWKVDVCDWEDRAAVEMAETLAAHLQPGRVVLLHDGLFDAANERFFARDSMLDAVELLLDRLSGRFHFITVPELLAHGAPQWKAWTCQESGDELNRLMRQRGIARRY